MTASIEELSRSVEGVKEKRHEADKVAKETNQLAEQGGQAVQQVGRGDGADPAPARSRSPRSSR